MRDTDRPLDELAQTCSALIKAFGPCGSEHAVRKAVTTLILHSGLPRAEHPLVLGDAALLTALALGRTPGESFSVAHAITMRLRRGLDDYTFGRGAFSGRGPADGEEADLLPVFLEQVHGFIRLFLATLDTELRARVLDGRDEDVVADELVFMTFRSVAAGRKEDELITRHDLADVAVRVSELVVKVHTSERGGGAR